MPAFKKGDTVRQVVPAPMQGTVEGFHVEQDTGELQFLVKYEADGETRERYFGQEQLEAVPAEPTNEA